jgi:hypothetical protein
MGFGLLLYANTALQGAILGIQTALRALNERGALDEVSGLLATFAERQRLVDKSTFDAMERRYSTGDDLVVSRGSSYGSSSVSQYK